MPAGDAWASGAGGWSHPFAVGPSGKLRLRGAWVCCVMVLAGALLLASRTGRGSRLGGFADGVGQGEEVIDLLRGSGEVQSQDLPAARRGD